MKAMISCAEAVRQLWQYFEGEIDQAQREKIEDHLAFCRRCCGEVEFIEELHRFLSSKTAEEIPADVHVRLLQTIDNLEGTG